MGFPTSTAEKRSPKLHSVHQQSDSNLLWVETCVSYRMWVFLHQRDMGASREVHWRYQLDDGGDVSRPVMDELSMFSHSRGMSSIFAWLKQIHSKKVMDSILPICFLASWEFHKNSFTRIRICCHKMWVSTSKFFPVQKIKISALTNVKSLKNDKTMTFHEHWFMSHFMKQNTFFGNIPQLIPWDFTNSSTWNINHLQHQPSQAAKVYCKRSIL